MGIDEQQAGQFEGAESSRHSDEAQGSESASTQEIDEALERIRSKIDSSAEHLKDRLGNTVYQIEGVIDSADQLMDRFIERVNTTATQTREVFSSAEKVAEHLEDPVGLVRKFPLAALAGALVGGLTLGLMMRREKRGRMSRVA